MGAEVIIERAAQPVAVIRQAEPLHRKISDCVALLPADSTATIDPDFAKDVGSSNRCASRAAGAASVRLMLDSTVAVAAERQGQNSRQLLDPCRHNRTPPPQAALP